MLRRTHARRRAGVRLLVCTIVVSSLGVSGADASGTLRADPNLSTRLDGNGTGTLVTTVRTSSLRDAVPDGSSPPRILVIGTGIQRSLFPAALQPSIVAPTAADGVDTHGYGTVAASVIFQLLPEAVVTSRRVPARDASWTLADMTRLAEALEHARADRDRYDLVLLAFPPQAALDPVSHLTGHVNYGDAYGKGMAMVVEAMLTNTKATDGPIVGIPQRRSLRDRLFATATMKQRDAIERYATQAIAWRRVTDAVAALSRAGVGVVAPSGDFTRQSNGSIQPLVTQTVYGLSALPEVITVGAAYSDGDTIRVSPSSGRGPTLALGAKPDLLAPADVMALLPKQSTIAWPDDSVRIPLARIDWATPGLTPTPCPSVTGVYRCVLQGSSMVSASVVAANLAAAVATGVPSAASARGDADDEILRGIAWSAASATQARAFESSREAYAWEQGAGVLTGLRDLDLASMPVALTRADIGEIGWDEQRGVTVPLWTGAAPAAQAASRISSFLGVEETGAVITLPYDDASRVTAATDAHSVTVTAAAGRYHGGIYAGRVTLTSPAGTRVTLPLTLTQDLPLDFRVNYAYNRFQTGGPEGERVENATAILFAGMPPNVGLVGTALKNFASSRYRAIGGDPTHLVILRHGTTKDSFTDPSVAAHEHGRGRIEAVPPGFYKIHVVTDHAVEAEQARGRAESLGIQLGSMGPDAVVSPGSNLLVSSLPPCGVAADGPLGSSCTSRSGAEIDPSSGLCVARNGSTGVVFRYYCGEIAFAIGSAVVSRAVHQIEQPEWKTCGVDLPVDGTTIDFEAIVRRSADCEGTTSPSSWSFEPKAPRCLGPSERAGFPDGHPSDLTVTFRSLAPAGLRNLPVAVMTYEFKLPALNTYTTAGLSFAYLADDAIIGVRFKAGDAATDDTSNGLLVVDGPNVTVKPALDTAGTKGSVFNEWAVMSANAAIGRLSLIVIPTRWTSTSLDPNAPIARVELCDVAMRVSTFAKQGWGQPFDENGTLKQSFPVLDRGLAAQIDPAKTRTRASFDPERGTFVDRGSEAESLHVAVQIPKNTTTDESAPHHVRSPRGGPAHFLDARVWDGRARGASVLPADYRAYDPGYTLTSLACTEGDPSATSDPWKIAAWETCRLVNEARESDEMLADIAPDIYANGRFFGVLALDHAAVARASGDVAFDIADGDDGGAFDAAGRWARANGAYVKRFPVGNFYDDLDALSLSLLGGVLSVKKDAYGNAVLTVRANAIGGDTYTVSTALA